MTDVDDDIEFPKELCVAVCGAAHNREFMIAVNDVKLEDTIDNEPEMPPNWDHWRELQLIEQALAEKKAAKN